MPDQPPDPHLPYNLDALVARARQWLRSQDLIPDALMVYGLVARFRREELQAYRRRSQQSLKEASGDRPQVAEASAGE